MHISDSEIFIACCMLAGFLMLGIICVVVLSLIICI